MSQNKTENTNHKKETTKQKSDRINSEESPTAAAGFKKPLEEERSQRSRNSHTESSTTSPSQKTVKSDVNKLNIGVETNNVKVDYIVNKKWKSLLPLLDSTGIPINKTLKDLLKMYPAEKVENAIAIVKTRKREQHIPNLSGYFVSALKGDWGSQNLVTEESDQAVDQGSIFRHWYDLSRELGYCSGQEIRSGEQWVCLTGSWEKWESAVQRGYSLSYLKKIIKRNQG